jgi:hypothetical protein
MTRDEWDALTPAAKCDLLEQRIAGDFFSESERDIVRDVVALARQNAHERDSAVERERLQRECVVCHADLEPDRVLVPHCNDCVRPRNRVRVRSVSQVRPHHGRCRARTR